jgi:hypothetical protein
MRRKTLLVLIGVLALGSASAWAQGSGRLTIQPFAGYRTAGHFDFSAEKVLPYDGIRVSDELTYGLSLGIKLNPIVTVEAMWSRSAPQFQGYPILAGAGLVDLFSAYEDQIHGNILAYLGNPDGLVRPFLVAGAGVTVANAKVSGISSETRFSFNVGAGFEKWINDRVGIRLTAKWFPTYINQQLSWFVDWWGFAYLVPVNQYMTQWDFTGGLVFRF